MRRNAMEDFRRDISYRLFTRGDGRIVLTAALRDRYHDIVLEVLVHADTLVIEEVGVDFRKAPTPTCRSVADRLARLCGIGIGKGLSRTLMEALGGENGCGNLRNLLLGLLPLAINVNAAAGFDDEQAMLAGIREKLRGTCAGYPREER